MIHKVHTQSKCFSDWERVTLGLGVQGSNTYMSLNWKYSGNFVLMLEATIFAYPSGLSNSLFCFDLGLVRFNNRYITIPRRYCCIASCLSYSISQVLVLEKRWDRGLYWLLHYHTSCHRQIGQQQSRFISGGLELRSTRCPMNVLWLSPLPQQYISMSSLDACVFCVPLVSIWLLLLGWCLDLCLIYGPSISIIYVQL